VVFALAEVALVLVLVGLLVLGAWAAWKAWMGPQVSIGRGSEGVLSPGPRRELAAAIAGARWAPAHDEVDGQTRVLVRKTYTGLDGRPVVLEERVIDTFAADDPGWEIRFIEGMSRARFRCTYLNAEEQPT
jgi:hypothetical protein